MTTTERTMNKHQSELEKLNGRLEKATTRYNKILEIAKKYGVDTWTRDDHEAWMSTVPTTNGWIDNKEDIKKNGAFFNLISSKSEIKDILSSIERAAKRLNKSTEAFKAEAKKAQQDEEEKQRAAVAEEWAKDGITVTGQSNLQIIGTTPKGNDFYIEKNAGMTKRSWHCVTLTINGETMFTSGDISTAYHYIKNH